MSRIAIIAAVILCFLRPAAAAECKLSIDECIQIERAMGLVDLSLERDRAALGPLKPYERGQKLITLKYAHLRRIAAQMPVCLGNEIARMYACDAARHLASTTGDVSEPKQCRQEPQRGCFRGR